MNCEISQEKKTRLKIPIEMYNKKPESVIQRMIGLNSKLIQYNRLSIITNDSCYLIDIRYIPQVTNKLIIIQSNILKYDEKNMRYIFLHNNQFVQIIKIPNTLPERLPLKIFKIQYPKDDIMYNAVIYKHMFTSILTPLKKDIIKYRNKYKSGKVIDRKKQINEY